MSDSTPSDELAAQRFNEFQREVNAQADAIVEQYSARRGAVEKAISAIGYEPEGLGAIVASAGMTGTPGPTESLATVLEDHRAVLEAVANELGVELKGDV